MSEPPPSLAAEGPPSGVHLLAYAALSADLAEGDRTQAEVLAAYSLTEEDFTRVTLFWARRMADDAEARGAEAKVPELYSEAFARAQDQKKAPPALTVEGWAALSEEIARADSPEPALRARGLTLPDYLRAARAWARALASEPGLHDAFEAAREAWILASEGPNVG